MPIEIEQLVIKARVCDQPQETTSEANRRARTPGNRPGSCAEPSEAQRAVREMTEILNRQNER